MLQDFTSDPGLLQEAAKRATNVAGQGLAQVDPRDDPNTPGNLEASALSGMPGHGIPSALQVPVNPAMDLFDLESRMNHFDRATYLTNMDERVRYTVEALNAIARHMSGYAGRKNLLWISTSFPICVDPALDVEKNHDYKLLERQLADALSDAKVAVYPINPAGVRPPSEYEAGARPVNLTPQGMLYSDQRETEGQNRELDTMRLMASGTGGEVCTGDNDIADCVHRTVDDSSRFYEIAYYPVSKNWNGEYRRIVLNTKAKGLHLEYRQGYFANADEKVGQPEMREALKHAACEGPLDATSILLTAKSMTPDSPDSLKFNLIIGTSTLTFGPAGNGNSEVNLQLAVCTFDQKGKPGQFMSIPLDRKLTASEVQKVVASGLEDIAAIPGPKPAALRLAVMDLPSGRIGSLRIQMENNANTALGVRRQNAAQSR
jgi:VWFA-related protein